MRLLLPLLLASTLAGCGSSDRRRSAADTIAPAEAAPADPPRTSPRDSIVKLAAEADSLASVKHPEAYARVEGTLVPLFDETAPPPPGADAVVGIVREGGQALRLVVRYPGRPAVYTYYFDFSGRTRLAKTVMGVGGADCPATVRVRRRVFYGAALDSIDGDLSVTDEHGRPAEATLRACATRPELAPPPYDSYRAVARAGLAPL